MNSNVPQPGKAVALHERAEDNLRFIRSAMESAGRFTGLSGKGFVLAGGSALIALPLAAVQEHELAWLAVWLCELLIAAAGAFACTARKAAALGKPLLSGSGRRLLLAFCPPLLAGGLLTLALFLEGRADLLPGVWLLLYGAGVITGGLHSISPVPLMGAAFMLLGAPALLWPSLATPALGLGFGGLHLLFGILIWRHHGG